MAVEILNGKEIADDILANVYKQVQVLGRSPSLAVILVGDNPASHLYVKLKEKAAKKVNIDFHKYLFEKDASEEEIIETIKFLNNDEDIDAILVQLPLDKKYNTDKIINTIDPKKDVDGFHSENRDKYINGEETLIIPGLNLAILTLLEKTNINLENKTATIITKNKEIFGKSLERTLREVGIKVNLATWQEYLENAELQNSDIIIIAIGQKQVLTADLVKDGAIVIDVGINKENGQVYGDADIDSLKKKVKAISPVPGGVGPMTVAFLLENTLNLAMQKDKK